MSKNGSDKINSVAVAVDDGFGRKISVTQCSKVRHGMCELSKRMAGVGRQRNTRKLVSQIV